MNDNEQTLEHILTNQDDHLASINDTMDKLLIQNDENNPEKILEHSLVKLDEISKNTENIAKSKISIEINGDATTTYQGEKGDKGDEPSEERLLELIAPLIPEVKDGKDGKDADENAIADKVLEIVLPEIPSAEDILAQIQIPTNGMDGADGLNGKDGLDADEDIIVEKVLAQIPKPKDGSPDSPKQVKEKLLKIGIKYDEIKGTPDLTSMMQRLNQASKTVSLIELDDVDLSSATKTNGKYVIPSSTGGTGTVTSVSVTTANGISGSVATDTTTPAISLTLGAITPTSVAASGTVTGSNLSGTNTGDQTNISGNAATVTTNANLTGVVTSVGNATAIADAALSIAKTSGLQAALDSKGAGTVTSVAALTLGTTGTDVSSSVATGTTTPVITLNIPTASAVNRGALSSTDWSTFNGKQSAITFGTGVQTALGVNIGSAGAPVLFNGALGTPASGTLTNTTGLPAASVVAGTLGTGAYTMDTKLTVPQVINTANAITATANAATIPVTSKHNIVTNNSAATLTVTLTTASAVNMQMVVVQILDFSAAAQTLTLVNTEDSTVTAPATTNGSTTLPLTLGFIYNSATSKWRLIAKA